MGRGKGRWWPLRRGLTEADVLDGVEWEEPGLRSGPTWTLSWPLAGWPPAVWLGTEGFMASRGGDGTSQCLSSLKSLNPLGLRLIIPPALSRDSSGRRGSVHFRVPPGQLPRVDPSLSSIFPLSLHLFLSECVTSFDKVESFCQFLQGFLFIHYLSSLLIIDN